MGNALIEIKKTSDPITLSEYELAYDMDRAAHDASYISTSLLTEISSAFFKSYSALTCISLSNVSVVGQSAFENCVNLNEIYLPSLDTFDAGAIFSNCEKISKVVAKSSIIHIHASAVGLFFNCRSISQIFDIDLVNDKIPDKIFMNCSNLKRVNLLSDNCTIIGTNAFYNCTKLEYVNNLNFAKIIDIGVGAFAYNSSLTDLEIYNFSEYKGMSLNNNVFAGCINLNYVSLPDNIRTLNNHVFAGCTNLKQINLNNVSYISAYAVYNVPNLSIININATELRLCSDPVTYPLDAINAAIRASNLLTIGTAYSGSYNYSRLCDCRININDGYSFPKLEAIHSITFSGGRNFSGTLYLPNLKYIEGYCETANTSRLIINNCIGVQGESSVSRRGNGFICNPNLITLEAMNLSIYWADAPYHAGIAGYEAYYSYNVHSGDVSKYERNTKIKNILAPYIGLCPGEYNFTYLCSDNVYRKTYSDIRRYYNLSNKKMYSTVEILGTRRLTSFFVSRSYPYDVSSNIVSYRWFSPISLFENLKEIYTGQYYDQYYSMPDIYPTYAICYTVSKINMFYDYPKFHNNHMYINFGTLYRIFPQLSSINMDIKFSPYDENNYSEPLEIILYNISKIINVNTNVNEIIDNYMLSCYLTFGDYVSDTDVNKYLGMINSKCVLKKRFELNFKNGCSINNLIVNARNAALNTFTIQGSDMHINNVNVTDCLDWKMSSMYFIVNDGLIDTISFNESSNNVETSLVASFNCYGSINNINFNVLDWSYIQLIYTYNSNSFAIRNMNFQYAKTIRLGNIHTPNFSDMLIQNVNAPNCTNFSVTRLPIRNISLGNELVSFYMSSNAAIENISLNYNGTCDTASNYMISACPNLKNLFIKASEIIGGYAAKNVLSMNADYISCGGYLYAKNIYINAKSLYAYNYPSCDYMYIKASSISRICIPYAAKTSSGSPCLIDLDVSFYCGSDIVSIYYMNTNAIIRVRPSLLSQYLSDSFYTTKSKIQFIALS